MDFNILDTMDLQVLGTRLQQARKQKGLTQLDAAALINAARTTITAIEKGERRIKADELIRLAQGYGCQVSDLVRARPAMDSFAVQLRSAWLKTEVDDARIAACVEAFESVCRDYLELEEITGARPYQNYPPAYRFDHLAVGQAAEIAAQQERSRLGQGDAPIYALRELLEHEVGLRIFYMEMNPADEVSAMYAYGERLGGAVAINRFHPEARRRFSLAQAYAHFLAQRPKAAVLRQAGHRRRPESEQFADRFAAHFLLPTHGVTRSYNAVKAAQTRFTLGNLLTLAGYYGVSLEAMALRLEELKLLPAGTLPATQRRGVNLSAAQEALELSPMAGYADLLPRRYQQLALQAYDQADISEGQLSRFLRVNRLEAREMAATFHEGAGSLLEIPMRAYSEIGVNQGA